MSKLATLTMHVQVILKCTGETYTYARRDKNDHLVSTRWMNNVSGEHCIATKPTGSVKFEMPSPNSTD